MSSEISPTFSITPLNSEEDSKIRKDFPGHTRGLVRVGPKGYVMTPEYDLIMDRIYNLELREDDIWVVTYPKVGTTWMQELVWQVANGVDLEGGKVDLVERYTFIEFRMFFTEELIEEYEQQQLKTLVGEIRGLENINDRESPRFMKTHLPFSLLPPKLLDTCKVVYVVRNPKDAAVSYYHHLKEFSSSIRFQGDFPLFWEYYKTGMVVSGSYWDNVEEGWELRNHPNLFFTSFEQMKKDLSAVIRDVAKFLNKPITDDQVETLRNHLQFENVQKNMAINVIRPNQAVENEDFSFIRKGVTGGWKSYFNDDLNKDADEMIEAFQRKTGIKLTMEL